MRYILILVIITILTYSNILPNKLFFDDEELIYKNAYVSDLRYFPKYFTTNMIAGAGKVSNMYRPVLVTSFAIDHFFWGNNPAGYHLTSMILHSLNAVLIFIVIYKLFNNHFIAFLTSVFFAVHPVNSEAVIYASGRTDPLMVFFSLLSIHFFISFLDGVKKRGIKYLLTIVFFILSLLSKESAVVIPLIFLLIFFIKRSFKKQNVFKASIILWPFFASISFYIFLRLTVLNFGNTLNFYTTSNLYSSNFPVRLYTFTKVFFDYLILLIFPRDLIIARDPEIIMTPSNPWVLIFLIINALIVYWVIRQKKKKQILPIFSFFWFYFSIFPSSGIIPINNIEAEHYLYFPSIGTFLLISFLCYKFFFWCHSCVGRNPELKRYGSLIKPAMTIIGIVILMLLSARTVHRTFDWRDPITFYSKSLTQSPEHIPMRNNLAMAYAENGQLEKAINQYQLIIRSNDAYPNVHHNLGNAYKELGRLQQAEQEYLIAVNMDPNFNFSYFALAELYQMTNQAEKYKQILDKINRIPQL